MGVRVTASTRVKSSIAKTSAKKRAAGSVAKKGAKTAGGKAVGKKKPEPTIATVSTQIAALSKHVEKLEKLLARALSAKAPRARATKAPKPRAAKAPRPRAARKTVAIDRDNGAVASEPHNGSRSPVDAAGFESDLLKVLLELDRSGRHAGLVPIPEVREAFLRRGWTRRTFDDRLLEAEREFIVDLKTANDPARLPEPDLAIEERGRGHLQYVVIR